MLRKRRDLRRLSALLPPGAGTTLEFDLPLDNPSGPELPPEVADPTGNAG
jgi:hypothetical protein